VLVVFAFGGLISNVFQGTCDTIGTQSGAGAC
jgi:hypothetical protein